LKEVFSWHGIFMKIDNDKAFDKQVEPNIGLGVEKHTEAKDNLFNKEQELFYRTTDYRGS
jgi:hypothetical protein